MTRKEKGFTLLEILVAFVIATVALAFLFRSAVSGVASTKAAMQYEEGLSLARSHLAVVGHGLALRPLDQDGDDGKIFHWHLRIVLLSSGVAERQVTASGPSPPMLALYGVSVIVSWPSEVGMRDIRLATTRLGVPPP
jgi:general secretion pathway protein I